MRQRVRALAPNSRFLRTLLFLWDRRRRFGPLPIYKLLTSAVAARVRPQNFAPALALVKLLARRKIDEINIFERKIYSQNGEDGIIGAIFHAIGITNRFYVELGVEDGSECNTRYLYEEKGWHGVLIDCNENANPRIKQEFVTAENVNALFEKYEIPTHFDLLSIDLDFNDYWVWRAIENFSPRVVIMEYNAIHPPAESRVVQYTPDARWDGTNYFGASLLALVALGNVKGYTLVGCDNKGVNAFFVRNDLLEGHFKIRDVEELYKPPGFGNRINGVYVGHPSSDKTMMAI